MRTLPAGPCLLEHSMNFQDLKNIRPWTEAIFACYSHEASPWCETFRWRKRVDCWGKDFPHLPHSYGLSRV